MVFKSIGYYICEIVNTPDWLDGIGDKMISVSECLGKNHPVLSEFFGKSNLVSNRDFEKKRADYRSRSALSKKLFDQLYKETEQLFDSGLSADGRFLNLIDAKHFYDKYFSEINCKIVSVSVPDECFAALKNEMAPNDLSSEDDNYPFIGCDILGWDHGGFHTFLCNSLHKDLSAARFNNLGLLENPFDEVTEFAREIQGKGEPVIWIPCKIGDCST